MVKVLIVDDELPIREWIAFCIRRLSIQCEIVGVASNGHEALELFRQHLPDLVIADIKMPLMDGIELLRQIRDLGSGARIAFLTSHGNFEYAREALRLGAHAYILKTEIQPEDIEKLFDGLDKPEADGGITMQIRRESFVRSLLSGAFDSAEAVSEERRQISFPLRKGPLMVAAIRLNGEHPRFDDSILARMDFIEATHCFTFDVSTLLVIAELNAQPSTLLMFEARSGFARVLSDVAASPVCTSGVCPGLGSLRRAAENCLRGLGMVFYDPRPDLCVFSDRLHVQSGEALQSRCDAISRDGVTRQALERLLDDLQKQPCLDVDTVKSCVSKLIGELAARSVRDSIALMEVTRALTARIQAASVFKELYMAVESVDGILAAQRDGQTLSTHVRLALRHLGQHYATAVSLSETADYVGLSSEYFSRLFKQEVGITFITYLNNFRLEKAIELLHSTRLKVYEVAERTGFSNLSYFSKQFRRQYGVSPFEAKKRSLPPLD